MTEQKTQEIDAPGALREYTWRAAGVADIPLIFALKLACDAADGTDNAATKDHLAREFDDPWLGDPAENTLLVLTEEGTAAGYGAVFANPEPLEKRQAYLEFSVHPDHRHSGIEDFLLGWLERTGRRVLAGIPADLPAALRTGVEDTLAERLALVERSGFRPVRHYYRMQRDLHKPIEPHPLPEGLVLRQYTPADELPLMAAFNEAFADHWNFEPVTHEDWLTWVVGTKEFRPELVYMAMDGSEIAGFAVNEVRPEENRRYGTNQGWVRELGTRRPWRRKGIASALLTISMHALLSAGLDYAVLGVDTENPTGALGIYERLGFEPYRRFVSFEKPIEENPIVGGNDN